MNVLVKLNDKAGCFFDPTTGQTLSGSDIGEFQPSERVSLGLKNGHLKKASEEEWKEFQSIQKAAKTAESKVKNLKESEKDSEEENAKAAEAEAKRLAEEEAKANKPVK